ncbi:3'-5' exonuclease [Herbaspirillum sp. C7C8]|uniref:3'-5' exonuclease n=1 Tax=Herbaspirillum sp. C7C8 TaxID=2736665 RepID=UPI001F52A2F6|nr:3'-5' exonuclease [Herbaspirillum sp. C7C8]
MPNDLDIHWGDCHFAVIDVEGNGQNPLEIIEIAVLHVRHTEIQLPVAEWMVLPEKPVTEIASRIHGITNSDLVGMPRLSEISTELFPLLGTNIIIGHNVSHDVKLIRDKIPAWHPAVLLDTLKLARRLLPNVHSYALRDLMAEYSISSSSLRMHRAAADVLVTAQLFLRLVKQLDKNADLTIKQLIELSGTGAGTLLTGSQLNLF